MAARVLLFSTDLDGTIVGDSLSCARFCQTWEGVNRGLRPLLVYNTGCSLVNARALIASRNLAEPDYLVSALGTELCDLLYNRVHTLPPEKPAAWDVASVEQIISRLPGIERQPEESQNPHKSSWFWPHRSGPEVADAAQRLQVAGIEAQVSYSSQYFLDIVPAWAGKGGTLARLCRRLHVSLENVLVAGDTATDVGMFQLPGVRGILVRNALPELTAQALPDRTYLSSAPMADGVLEGLRHFGVIPGSVFTPVVLPVALPTLVRATRSTT